MKKYILPIFIVIALYLIFQTVKGYNKVNQDKYGISYNSERSVLGIVEIPASFILTERPVNDIFDYIGQTGIYSLVFITDRYIDSGLVKKRINVDENGIGIIREYSYIKEGNDTTVDIYNYYE